jgi:hypothetical protein
MPHTKIKRPIKYFSFYKDYTEMAQSLGVSKLNGLNRIVNVTYN